MPIVYKSNDVMNREKVLDYIKAKKLENPEYKVIDVGGSANPWCEGYVDAYVDFIDSPDKRVIQGDINEAEVWDVLSKEKWDFCICTHTLEDIRDPKYVLNNIRKIASAGFISVPNKHTELSSIESKNYLGFCHHRWIFQITNLNVLRAIGKFHIINNLLPFRRSFLSIFDSKNSHGIKWVDKELVGRNYELAFIWEDTFDFEFINNDFAGESCRELSMLFVEDLSEGL